MADRCTKIVWRIPIPEDGDMAKAERHQYRAVCGLPVVRDGLCKVHLRKRGAARDDWHAVEFLRRMIKR